jgi:hypothetical protein
VITPNSEIALPQKNAKSGAEKEFQLEKSGRPFPFGISPAFVVFSARPTSIFGFKPAFKLLKRDKRGRLAFRHQSGGLLVNGHGAIPAKCVSRKTKLFHYCPV